MFGTIFFRKKQVSCILALACACLFTPISLTAQNEIDNHSATQQVLLYLRHSMGQNWEKSGQLISPMSLANLRDRYVMRIKQAATIDEEMEMVRRLDRSNLREVEKMDPMEFYISYHKGLQERFEVTEEILSQIVKTTQVKVLSLAEETVEGVELAHVLVRTRHQNAGKRISSLDLVSLVKLEGKWKVTLEAMAPLVTDIPTPN